jgi:hypothetical protein
LPAPQTSGSVEEYELLGPDENVVHFAGLKVLDDVPNVSGLSNVVRIVWSKTMGLAFPVVETSDCGTIALPLLVSGFEAVAGVQIYVGYDDSHATFDSVTSTQMNDIMWNESSEVISLIWADMSLTSPLTLGNNDTLATFYFSNLTGVSAVEFQSQTKVVDTAAAYFTVETTDGSMTCTGGQGSDNDPALIGTWNLVSVNGQAIVPGVFLRWVFTATTITSTSDMDCVEVLTYSSAGGVLTGLSVVSRVGSECGHDDGGGELGGYSVVGNTLTVTMYDPEMEPPMAVFVFTRAY